MFLLGDSVFCRALTYCFVQAHSPTISLFYRRRYCFRQSLDSICAQYYLTKTDGSHRYRRPPPTICSTCHKSAAKNHLGKVIYGNMYSEIKSGAACNTLVGCEILRALRIRFPSRMVVASWAWIMKSKHAILLSFTQKPTTTRISDIFQKYVVVKRNTQKWYFTARSRDRGNCRLFCFENVLLHS